MTAAAEHALQPSEVVRVAGRTFRPARKTTLKQDLFIWERLEATGLDGLASQFNPTTGQLTHVMEQAVLKAYVEGTLFEILAGILVEDGAGKWTPEVAHGNAEFFSELEEEDDKAAIRGPMITVILHFFVLAANSHGTFPKYSVRANEAASRSASSQPSTDPPIEPEMSPSDSGMTSSAILPDMIPMSSSES